MRTFLVAVVAHNHQDVQKFLLASPLGPSNEEGIIDCWWVAEDDREDGSDTDSAIFVPRGGQEDVSSVVRNWIEHHTEEWDEEGYPFAATDVSGAWYLSPDQRRAAREYDLYGPKPLLEERPEGTFYLGELERAKNYARACYGDALRVTRNPETGVVVVGEFMHAAESEMPNQWGTSATGDEEEAWRYFLGVDFGPIDEEYNEVRLRVLLAGYRNTNPATWPATDAEREQFQEWTHDVGEGNTHLGFRDWLAAQIEEAS